MTLFIVSPAFPAAEPIAVFDTMPDAHAYVLRQDGKYNRWQVTELDLNAEKPTAKRAARKE